MFWLYCASSVNDTNKMKIQQTETEYEGSKSMTRLYCMQRLVLIKAICGRTITVLFMGSFVVEIRNTTFNVWSSSDTASGFAAAS